MAKFKSVLIVEDDPDISETMRMIVESEGYHAETASNGKEALKLLQGDMCGEPCLILLDLMMPEMNGWEFMEIRRQADVIAAIPVIIVSAVAPSKGVPEGARKVLRKPIDLETLMRDVSEFCSEEVKEEILRTSEVVGKPQEGTN